MNKKLRAILIIPATATLIWTVDRMGLLPGAYVADERDEIAWRRAQNREALEEYQDDFTVAFAGSSRSERFFWMYSERKENPYIDKTAALRLSKIRLINYTHIGGLAITYLQSLEHSINAGNKPDLLLMEIAPEVLEAGHKNLHAGSDFLFSPDTSREQLRYILTNTSDPLIREAARKHIWFPGFHSRIRPENLISPPLVTPLPFPETRKEYREYDDRNIPDDLRQERVTFFVNMYGKNYAEYKTDPLLVRAFRDMALLARRNDIRVLFWIPYVQQELGFILEGPAMSQAISELSRFAQENEIPLVRVNREDMRCRMFTDASHYSNRCTPELLILLIDASGTQEGES